MLLENTSPKEASVTRFACDSRCVTVDDILSDFCFDIFPPGFVRAIQGRPEGEDPGRKPGPVALCGAAAQTPESDTWPKAPVPCRQDPRLGAGSFASVSLGRFTRGSGMMLVLPALCGFVTVC